MIKPISIAEAYAIQLDDLSVAIKYINENIRKRNWHDQINKVPDYHAIILTPYGQYINLMDNVVEKFKAEGWNCYWGPAKDARGPHYCFYVSIHHFNDNK